MGNLYLTGMAQWLRDAGLNVTEYSGWQTRSRSSGGFDANPLCVMWHHTASNPSSDGKPDCDYMCNGSSDRPIANLYIQRNGTVWVLAAGATNTNGKGNSIAFSRGTVPQDSMNTRAVGVEMANNGVGEQWPQVQVDAMFVVSNTINAKLGNQPTDVSSHQFYAPTRKIDPATTNVAGPWKPSSVNSSGSWNRSDIQNECAKRAQSNIVPPTPTPPDNGDDMAYACEGIWILNDNGPVCAVYSGGYKTWIFNNDVLVAKQSLCVINGVDSSVQVTSDPAMFAAFGPIIGPRPQGWDEWGLPC
jgi:hypothetical protein